MQATKTAAPHRIGDRFGLNIKAGSGGPSAGNESLTVSYDANYFLSGVRKFLKSLAFPVYFSNTSIYKPFKSEYVMYIGHYGVGLALKKTDNKLSLGLLFLSVTLIDIIHYVLGITGVENVEIVPGFTRWVPIKGESPYTHSLAGIAFISLMVFAAVMFLGRMRGKEKDASLRASLVLSLGVLSHFLCDVIVHAPDIYVSGLNSPKMGFGLWNYPVVSNSLEIGMFAAGLLVYFRSVPVMSARFRRNILVFALCLTAFHLSLGLVPSPDSIVAVYSLMIAVSLLVIVIAWRLEKGLR